MRKIIDGKIYDSSKAELITSFRRQRPSVLIPQLYHWAGAELYKTKKGNWFELVGTETGDSRLELNVLTEYEAKRLLENVSPGTFEKIYPNEIEEA